MNEPASQPAERGSRGPWLAATSLLLTLPLLLRWLLLTELTPDQRLMGPLGRIDLRGVLSDLGIAASWLLLIALTRLGSRRLRPLAVGLAVAFGLFTFADYESVRALRAGIALEYAGYAFDPTFLFGSMTSPRHPWLLLGAVVALGGVTWLASAKPPRRPLLAALAVTALGAGLGQALWPRDASVAGWRQEHSLAGALRRTLTGTAADSQADPTRLDPELARIFAADLTGKPRISLGRGRHNVLLIVLESVSGGFLPSVATSHGLAPGFAMHQLDEVAANGLSYSSFVAQQRQTNRGEYALLCGDPPELRSQVARFVTLAAGERQTCLATVLGAAGYRTSYLQAAPLAFMLKDQALPAIGFAEVLGEQWFTSAHARSVWGVDDRAFFEQSRRHVEALAAGDEPFFLTLLTAGTHHPYTVPETVVQSSGGPSLAATLGYLDEAFGDFAQWLEQSGLRDDTLILITSDESAGIWWDLESRQDLSQNWGFLVALTPEGERGVVAEPYVQSDLALSVLDYLGLPTAPVPFVGRSVFRTYTEPRPIVFANTYARTTRMLGGDGRLLSCEEGTWRCRVDPQPRPSLFTTLTDEVAAPSELIAGLRAVVDRAEQRRARTSGPIDHELQLIASSRESILDHAEHQTLFGGQYLEVPAGSTIDVELALRVEEGHGWVHVRHDLAGRDDQGRPQRLYLAELPTFAPGDGVDLAYRLRTPMAIHDLEARAAVDRLAGNGMTLTIETASLHVSSSAPGDSPGLEVIRNDIVRVNRPPTFERRLVSPRPGDLAPCATFTAGTVGLIDCPPGPVVFGPRFVAPKGSDVRLELVLTGGSAPVTLRTAIGAERPPIQLAQGEPIVLAAGERRTFAVDTHVTVVVNELVGGLFVHQADTPSTGTWRVESMRALVQPP